MPPRCEIAQSDIAELAARVRRAQQLLESTRLSVERIATATGFESASAFRARFVRCVGTSPTAYRRAFARREA